MTLKGRKVDIKHFFVQGNEEVLDLYLENMLNSEEGWEYKDSKVLQTDWYSRNFVVMYILQRQVKDV